LLSKVQAGVEVRGDNETTRCRNSLAIALGDLSLSLATEKRSTSRLGAEKPGDLGDVRVPAPLSLGSRKRPCHHNGNDKVT
jgi:hypothetical protein